MHVDWLLPIVRARNVAMAWAPHRFICILHSIVVYSFSEFFLYHHRFACDATPHINRTRSPDGVDSSYDNCSILYLFISLDCNRDNVNVGNRISLFCVQQAAVVAQCVVTPNAHIKCCKRHTFGDATIFPFTNRMDLNVRSMLRAKHWLNRKWL